MDLIRFDRQVIDKTKLQNHSSVVCMCLN